jgi:hypothetical protein
VKTNLIVSNSNNNNNYIYTIYHAETEDEVRAIALNELYERTRQKVKASGGINTQQQAMEEILQEAREQYAGAIEELAAFDVEIWEKYNKYRLPTFEELNTEEYSFDLAFADSISNECKNCMVLVMVPNLKRCLSGCTMPMTQKCLTRYLQS